MNTPKMASPKMVSPGTVPPKIISQNMASSQPISPKLPNSGKKTKSLEYILIAFFLIVVTVMGVLTFKRFLEAQPTDPTDNKIKILTEVANKYPDDLEARLMLAYTYQEQENWEEAKKVYQDVLTSDPKNQGALYNMAIVAASNNKYDEAEKGFKKLIQLYPGHLLGVVALSKLYLEEKKPDLALQYIEKGIKMSPQLADLYVFKGQAYEMKGDKTKAKAQYQESLKYLPGMPAALEGLKRLK